MKTLRTFCLIAIAASLAAQERRPPNIVVIVDAQRGALVRWSMPQGAFPPGGFQLARVSANGASRIVATLRPGDLAQAPALSPDRQKTASDFLALLNDASKLTGEQAENARMAIQFAVASDPDLAAFLGLSYEDREAPRGETVTYVVSRVDAAGRAGTFASAAPTVITPTRLPDPPQDLRAEVAREGVAFFWSPPPVAAGTARAVTYEIRKREGARMVLVTPRPVLRVTSPDADFAGVVDAHPAVESTNAYTITSLDLFGRRGPESKPLEVFAPDFSALDPPTSVIASSLQGNALVTWQAPTNANRKGWKVVRSTQPDGIGPILTTVPTTDPRLVDSGVAAGTTYYYRVTAVNRRDEEGKPRLSPAVSIRSARPPAAPTALAATVKTGRVIVTWTPSADVVAGYQVERSPDGREWTLLTSIAGSEPRYVDAIPSDTTGTLQYRVIAWARDDTPSAASTPLVVTLPDHNPPATPILQSIDGTGGTITLRFLARGGAGDATQYVVLRGDAEDEPGIVVGSGLLGNGTQTFVDSEVLAGGLYFYRLVAVDAAGNRSDPNDPPNAIRAASPPLTKPAPPKVRLDLKPFRRVAIDIPPSPNASVLYGIERRTSDARWEWIQGPLPATTTRAFDNTPPKSGIVAYRIVAISIDGTPGPASDEVNITMQ